MNDWEIAERELFVVYLDVIYAGYFVGSPTDIAARVLVGNRDTPALAQLGGMSRSSTPPDIADVIRAVGPELEFPFLTGASNRDKFCETVLELINSGAITPVAGARRIWLEGWEKTTQEIHDSLRRLVALVAAWDEAEDQRTTLERNLAQEAHELTSGRWSAHESTRDL